MFSLPSFVERKNKAEDIITVSTGARERVCVKFNFELDDQFSQNLVAMLFLTRTTSNNIAVVRTCEVVATLASLTPGSPYYNW